MECENNIKENKGVSTMAMDWDMELFDITVSKMCTGCKFYDECFPEGSQDSMELNNIAQMTICASENIKNKWRPSELTYGV